MTKNINAKRMIMNSFEKLFYGSQEGIDINHWIGSLFTRRNGPYDQRVVQIISVDKNFIVTCIELSTKTVNINPEITFSNGGTNTPYKTLVIDANIVPSKPFKVGKLVLHNINNVPKIIIYDKGLNWELTNEHAHHGVILDCWKPGHPTNLGIQIGY